MPTARPHPLFDPKDLEELRRHGVSAEDAAVQLGRLRRGSALVALERPATIGDGIERAGERAADLERAGRDAARAGRCSFFVPASGAATRMFADLVAPEPEAARRFLDALPRLALRDALGAELTRHGQSLGRLVAAGEAAPILEALLSEQGLGYAHLPKGLVPFHRGPTGNRTALEEHLEDAAVLIGDQRGVCRLHFTVSPEHQRRFAGAAREDTVGIGARAGVRFELVFSTQDPATDCLAATPEGTPFRDRSGALLLRPGGHGALLANLRDTGGDLVFLKNVDNVAAAPHKSATYQWVPRVLGRLAELERAAFDLLARLDEPSDADAAGEARRFATEAFHRATAPSGHGDPRAHARSLLERPIRVCGMVPNTGEPGGGPFWVKDADGSTSLQIVESAQVSDSQRSIFGRGTHFNPVFMACGLSDRNGRAHALERFVDHDAAIVTRKTWEGRELLALERPGLWNGGMAKWNTVFIEVPVETFTPVKTVFDLLRPEHRGEG